MRKRMLNPEFFTDPDIVANFDFAGRLFYQGLWCVAEDSGCFELNPLFLKMKIFPGDNIDLETLQGYLNKLIELKKVVTYEVNGKRYGWLKNFHKHQTLNKPSAPTIPLPDFIKWHGEEEFGKDRHKYYYEILYPEAKNESDIQRKDDGKTEEGQRKDNGKTEDGQKRKEEKGNRKEEKRKEGEEKENNCRQDSEPSPDDPADNPVDNQNDEPKFDENSVVFKATCYLIDRILANNPRARVPNKDPGDPLMQKWCTEMDRLNRLGPPGGKEGHGYGWNEIKTLIDWCQDNNFWKSNILSAAKLREKIVTLENQMKSELRKRGNPNGSSMSKNVADALKLVEKYRQKNKTKVARVGGDPIW